MFANSIAYEEAHTTKGLIKINEKVKKKIDSNWKPCKKNKILTKRSGKKSTLMRKPIQEKLSNITRRNNTNEKKKSYTKYIKTQPLIPKISSDEKENVTSSSQKSTAQKRSSKISPSEFHRYPLREIKNVILTQ